MDLNDEARNRSVPDRIAASESGHPELGKIEDVILSGGEAGAKDRTTDSPCSKARGNDLLPTAVILFVMVVVLTFVRSLGALAARLRMTV